MQIIKKIIICIISLLIFQKLHGQDLWTLGTADNLKKFYCEVGAFQPVRFGLTNRIEVASNGLSNIFSPNFSVKKQWWKREILIATQHGIYYPKPGIKMAQNTGFRDWISDTVFIPKITFLRNELLISRYFKKCDCCANVYLITGKIGMLFNAIKNDSTFIPLNHTLLFPRTSVLNNYYLWNFGIDLEGPVFEWLDFSIDIDYNIIFGTSIRSIEHKLAARYKFSDRWNFFAGYKLAMCSNPNIKNFYFRPFIDAVYKFNIPTKPKNGLWKGRQKRVISKYTKEEINIL